MTTERLVQGPAFVTGGSSGIGFQLALKLAGRGQAVAIFARDTAKLEQARQEILATATSACVLTFPVDVADNAKLKSCIEDAVGLLGVPTYAIASAGIAEPGLFLEQTLNTHRQQMEVNYFGTLHFVHLVSRLMATNGGGRLGLISSGAAYFGIYGYGAYGPTKFAVRGLAETLQVELAEDNISVTLCCPGDTDTPQLQAEAKTKPKATKLITASGGVWRPETVARKMLESMDKGRFLVSPGVQMTLLGLFGSLVAPALRVHQRYIARRVRKGHKRPFRLPVCF